MQVCGAKPPVFSGMGRAEVTFKVSQPGNELSQGFPRPFEHQRLLCTHKENPLKFFKFSTLVLGTSSL